MLYRMSYIRRSEKRSAAFGVSGLDPFSTLLGAGSRIRTGEWWDGNPRPYHLAMPADSEVNWQDSYLLPIEARARGTG